MCLELQLGTISNLLRCFIISQIYKCWMVCVAAICTDFFILNLFMFFICSKVSNSHNDFMEKVNKNIDFLIILLLQHLQNDCVFECARQMYDPPELFIISRMLMRLC